MKGWRLVGPRIIRGRFLDKQEFIGPVEFKSTVDLPASTLATIVDAVLQTMGVTTMAEQVVFVKFTQPDGDVRAINPKDVEQVEELSATNSRIKMKETGNVTVVATVDEIIAALENA